MANVKHFIITRFCYAQFHEGEQLIGAQSMKQLDPLRPEYLNFRLKLLKIFAAASIFSQQDQNFTWLIIIDQRLPSSVRDQLEEFRSKKSELIIHEYDQNVTVQRLDWIKEYIEEKSIEYLVTTLHDDDDVLPQNFTHQLNRIILEKAQQQIPIHISGFRKSEMWDLSFSEQYPFGTKSDWPSKNMVASCGFSLFAKYPDIHLNILDLTHNHAINYLNLKLPSKEKKVLLFREELKNNHPQIWLDLQSYLETELFEDVSKFCGPTIMANHSKNTIYTRLYNNKVNPHKVIGPKSFPNRPIHWQLLEENISAFRKDSLLKRIYMQTNVYKEKIRFLFSRIVGR